MRRLEDFTIWQRIVLAIVIVAATFFALLALSKLFGEAAAQQRNPTDPPILYEGLQLDPILLALDKRALDEAYHEQQKILSGVWLASGGPEDARNFRNGLRIARRSYDLARDAVAAREKQIIELDRQHGQKP